MKGVVFRALEDFIVENWGEAVYEEVLARCPVATPAGAYVGPESYPDGELYAIVDKTCEILQVEPPVAVQAFGRFLYHRLASMHPEFVRGYDSPAAVLRHINPVIHVEVRKMMRDADPPRMYVQEREGGVLTLEYHSERKLCTLLRGLIDGLAESFGQRVEYRELSCSHHGAPHCTFELRFAAMEAAA